MAARAEMTPHIFVLVEQVYGGTTWTEKASRLRILETYLEGDHPLERILAIAGGIIPILLDGLELPAENSDFRVAAIGVLALLVFQHVTAAREVLKHRGMETLIRAIKEVHSSSDERLPQYLTLLAKVCQNSAAQDIVLKKGGMPHIIYFLKSADLNIVARAANALSALIKDNVVAKNRAIDEGVLDILIKILQNPWKEVCHEAAFLALDTLIYGHRYACHEFLEEGPAKIAEIIPHIVPYADEEAMVFYRSACVEGDEPTMEFKAL